MKFLSLLGSVYFDWFTVRKKFTFCVALIFFLASFVMTFTASLLGGKILWTDDEIDRMIRQYDFSQTDFRKNFVNSFIDNFSSLENENVSACSIRAYGYFIDPAKDKYTRINLLPFYAENDECRNFLAHITLVDISNSKYFDILNDYSASDGRLVSDSDYFDISNVIVMPSSLGLKVGDKVNLSNYTLDVIGLTEKNTAEIPATTLEEICKNYMEITEISSGISDATISYTITYFSVNDPVSKENRIAIEDAVSADINDDFYFTQFVPPSNGLEAAYVIMETSLGAVVAVFSILCVYNVALRLCSSAMPMMQLFKLCGMKRCKIILILFISLFLLLAICYGLACFSIVITYPVFNSITEEYVVRAICFILSAVIMTATALIAILPQIFKLAEAKPDTLFGDEK